ncbi:MAG: hypothetical protein ACR2IS_04455 [Nitrososphaeraceae archaeon]
MAYLYKKSGFVVLFTLVFAITSFTSLIAAEPQQAVAQSPMDMMDMMMGGGNMTGGTMMGDNMSLPFNMGVLAMPMMCTTPNQLLGSLSGMFGGMTGDRGDDANATQQMMMEMMEQQMMSAGGLGMENMTENDLQKAMDLVICIPVMGEEMIQSMMGNGNNSMMNGMMMQ